MKCKICSKMFTPPANKKITDMCSQCDKGISENNLERNEDYFENIFIKSKKYYKEQMDLLDNQIKKIEEVPDTSLENTTDFDYQEESPSTIERLREYANRPKPEQILKKTQLENLKKKYPYVKSPFNKYRDRDQYKQYWKLVSTKELKVAEFVLKWEYEHQKRMHKDMAWKLLTERKNKGEISDEFLRQVNKEYEE